jgi:RimJ/RimL family protein N-acetyltransferase/predicted SprT family Zn-dependent metalloprotease
MVELEMTRIGSPPAPTLSGVSVTLAQLNANLIEPYLAFLAEPEARRLTATTAKFTREKIVDWLQTRPHQTNRCDWAILDSESQEFLGEVVLNELDLEKQSMNLRIALAHPSLYGQGIGTEALRLVLRHAFYDLKLDQVHLEVLVENERAIKAYGKVGFIAKREFSQGKNRFLRMRSSKLDFIAAEAQSLMAKYLTVDPAVSGHWQFAFDSGKRRAGACHYDKNLISLSRYFAFLNDFDATEQVMLHEIAHALCDSKTGHSAKWKQTAASIGYRHEKLDGTSVADFSASWVGACPAGHKFYRYRKPTRPASCNKCHRGGYSEANRIVWQQR